MKMEKFRDLTLISINEKQLLVIACDSSGAIGNKKYDVVKVSPDIVGYYTTSVALSEVLAFGAKPISIINTLSVEMDNTGKLILEGIKRAIKPLLLEEEIIVNGSTEENFPVYQTGMGVTVIGIIDKSSRERFKTKKGMIAVVVGVPKVGDEVVKDNGNEILTISTLLKLIENPNVSEILPVGSKGILFEAKEMARTNDVIFKLEEENLVDLQKSAGPATCAVVSMNDKDYEKFKEVCEIPVNIIGRFSHI